LDSTGHTHVFVRGPNNIILTAVRGSGAWAGFFQVGDDGDHAASGTSIAAAAVSRRVYVLVRGPSGGLFTSYSSS
jgi:hypothetical protein